MPSYATRKAWQLATIDSKSFPAVNRLSAKCLLKCYGACDVGNLIFRKRLELVRMVRTDWSLASDENIPGSTITGDWVRRRFLYGESVELLTPSGLCEDVVEILWNAKILLDALTAWDNAPEEWVKALNSWILGIFANSSIFGVLDLEFLEPDLADFWERVYWNAD